MCVSFSCRFRLIQQILLSFLLMLCFWSIWASGRKQVVVVVVDVVVVVVVVVCCCCLLFVCCC